MSVIKQISIHNGNSWGNPYDIGANAENVSLIDNNGEPFLLAGSYNVRGALSNILPMSRLSSNTVVVTDSSGRLSTSNSNISSDVLNTALAGASATTSLQSQIDTLNNTTITGIQNTLNTLSNKIIIPITDFYDNRCRNQNGDTGTYIFKIGSICIISFGVTMLKKLTGNGTSIIKIPNTILAPAQKTYGISYNLTKKRAFAANISEAGNVNLIHEQTIQINDLITGQIVWIEKNNS